MQLKKISMSKVRSRYKSINIDKKWLIIGLLLLIASFFINIWPIILISVFCLINIPLMTIDRYVQAPLDVELSTFSSILLTLAYGLPWGLAAAVLVKAVSMIYTRKIMMDHFFMIGGYMIAAWIASLLSGIGSIFWIGVLATIVVNLYIVFISKYVTMLSNYEIVMYGSTNMIFNFIMFFGFAELFKKILLFLGAPF